MKCGACAAEATHVCQGARNIGGEHFFSCGEHALDPCCVPLAEGAPAPGRAPGKPRLIIGVQSAAVVPGMWSSTIRDEEGERRLREMFSDHEVCIVHGASGMLALPPRIDRLSEGSGGPAHL